MVDLDDPNKEQDTKNANDDIEKAKHESNDVHVTSDTHLDNITLLQLCMNQSDSSNMVEHYLDIQFKLLQQVHPILTLPLLQQQQQQQRRSMIIGSVMLGIEKYVTHGIKGLFHYIHDSREQRKPLLAHAFPTWFKRYTLHDLTEDNEHESNITKYKSLSYAIYKSKFWYFAFLNLVKQENKIHTWNTLKYMLHKIWNHKKAKGYKMIRCGRETKSGMKAYYNFKVFYTDDFETECWKPICEYWIQYVPMTSATRSTTHYNGFQQQDDEDDNDDEEEEGIL